LDPDNPTLRFLYSLQKSGIKAGLANIRVLLEALGHPEKSFPAVHIAGTNGKGSTAAMVAAVLTAAGYRTGLYTSPHLLDFTERIRIDGRKVSMDRVVRYTRSLRGELRRTHATFFEATTAIAFRHFADQNVDVGVIETGLGGRWDSTNVIRPLVSVITSIGLEHREYLGDTIRDIAFEKGGIIKDGTPCVVGDIPVEAMKVIAERGARRGARIVRTMRTTSVTNASRSLDGTTADFRVAQTTYRRLHVAAPGKHQVENARVSLQVLDLLSARPGGFGLDERAIRKGLASLHEYAGFSGRLQVLRRSPLIIADVAHNTEGTAALVASLRDLHAGKFRVVFGVMRDKDYRAMLDLLSPVSRMFYPVRPDIDRSRDPMDMVDYLHQSGVGARRGGSVREGVEDAIMENRCDEPVLVTGSHYVVGEAMRTLGVRV